MDEVTTSDSLYGTLAKRLAEAEDAIERLQRELAAEREDAHKWRTYTMHLGVAKAVEAQVKAERERYEARAELERVRGALRLHIPDLEKMAAALWKIRGFEKTADQFDLAAKELRAALGGEG